MGEPIDSLVQRAVDGDAAAWRALWAACEPTVWAITGKWRITGALARRDDDRRNIVLDVMERLRADDFRRLRSYLASPSAARAFQAWLATVTTRVAIDHVRAHPEFHDARGSAERGDGAPRWVTHVEMPRTELVAPAPDPARRATAMQLLARARTDLEPLQLTALCLWLGGEDHDEIARRLGLSVAREADRVVRAALKRLRDRYATGAVVEARGESEADTMEETT